MINIPTNPNFQKCIEEQSREINYLMDLLDVDEASRMEEIPAFKEFAARSL